MRCSCRNSNQPAVLLLYTVKLAAAAIALSMQFHGDHLTITRLPAVGNPATTAAATLRSPRKCCSSALGHCTSHRQANKARCKQNLILFQVCKTHFFQTQTNVGHCCSGNIPEAALKPSVHSFSTVHHHGMCTCKLCIPAILCTLLPHQPVRCLYKNIYVHCLEHVTRLLILRWLDGQPEVLLNLLDRLYGLPHSGLGHTHLTHPAGHAIVHTHNLQGHKQHHTQSTQDGMHIVVQG